MSDVYIYVYRKSDTILLCISNKSLVRVNRWGWLPQGGRVYGETPIQEHFEK